MEDEARQSLEFLLDKSTPERTVLIVESDINEFSRSLMKINTNISNVNLHTFSTCTSSEVVEIIQASSTAIDIGRRISPEIVFVQGIYDAAMMNKSLPSNLSALPLTTGRRICYLIDGKDRDARRALLRRDFLRTLGTIVFNVEKKGYKIDANVKQHERNLKSFIKELETLYLVHNDVDKSVDTWAVYENLSSARYRVDKSRKLSKEELESVIGCYMDSSVIDKLSLERDFYALTSIAEDIRIASTAMLEIESEKKSTQLLTRCGMHANLCRDAMLKNH